MWTTPKTNWKKTDSFSVDTDYGRIKGNIEYLFDLAATLYDDFEHYPLADYTVLQYPRKAFFNNIVLNVEGILENCYSPPGSASMRHYTDNGLVWNWDELNAIEGNLLRLYNAMQGEINIIRTLEFKLGVSEI